MSKNPQKDFGPISEDYEFFENHATEAREDVRAYVDHVRDVVPAKGAIRLLDFGCGSGTVTARFLEQTRWPPERLQLTLVEPVTSARHQAVARVASLTTSPVVDSETLPADAHASFDCILANHVFYYVSDLQEQLSTLIDVLSDGGILITAMAGRTNALIEFWTAAFGLLGKEIPYYTSEDLEAALHALGADYDQEQVAYELSFPDTRENRMRIIRFLLVDYLAEMPQEYLLALFDQHHRAGRIEIATATDHFTVRP